MSPLSRHGRVSQTWYDVSRQAEQLPLASWRKIEAVRAAGDTIGLPTYLGTIISNQPANHTSHAIPVGTKGLDGVGRGLLGMPAYRYMAKTRVDFQ